jgi:hypothetical protein
MKVVLLAAPRSGRTSARWPVDGAEDAARLVLAWRHHLHSLALDDPGRAHPGQQVGVGLVLARDHRPLGRAAIAWWRAASLVASSGSLLATNRVGASWPVPAPAWRRGPGTSPGNPAVAPSRLAARPPACGCARRAGGRPAEVHPGGASPPGTRCPPGCSGRSSARWCGGRTRRGAAISEAERPQREPDHDEAQGEAPGPVEQGDDLGFGGGGLGENMSRTQKWCWPRWTWWKTPTRLFFCAADAPLARPRIRSRTGSATIRYAFFVGLMRDGRIGGSRFVARRPAAGCNPAREGRVPGA